MKKRGPSSLGKMLGAALLALAFHAAPAVAQSCGASVAWFTNPSIPTEVSGGLNANNCAFHQLAWQAFAALIQPQTSGGVAFEGWMPDYGLFPTSGPPTPWGQDPTTPCTGDDPKARSRFVFRPRTPKLVAGAVNPNSTDQATGNPLIDQNGNVVYYEAWVNQTEYNFVTGCQFYDTSCIALAPANVALPPGSIELKTSWRILPGPSSSYYTVQGQIGSNCQTVTLGLVGFHLVINTPDHPEFIWATFEHKSNAPDCSNTSAPPPAGGWSFYNPKCSTTDCPVNQPTTAPTPTQVCRVTPQGGGDSQNVANIQAVNQSVYSTMQKLAAVDPTKYGYLNTWSNYFLAGNLWTNQGQLPPSSANEKGSTLNANTTMETFAQNTNGLTNCFSCHQESGAFQQSNSAPANFSHLFFEAVETGACGGGKLPAACTASLVQTKRSSKKAAAAPKTPKPIPSHPPTMR